MEEKCMKSTMLGEKAYRPKDIAYNLGKNIETVRRWIRNGKLKSNYCGGQYYVVKSDLEKFLKGE